MRFQRLKLIWPAIIAFVFPTCACCLLARCLPAQPPGQMLAQIQRAQVQAVAIPTGQLLAVDAVLAALFMSVALLALSVDRLTAPWRRRTAAAYQRAFAPGTALYAAREQLRASRFAGAENRTA